MLQMHATADTRYSFTAQFLHGAAIFTGRAHEIEQASTFTDRLIVEHRAYVVGAIVQSAAAIESEIAEVAMHGPGHHLGSDHTDHAARDFLLPIADFLSRQKPPLRKYDLVLHFLKKPALDHSSSMYQSAGLLFQLRNDLMHYKSKWGNQMKHEKKNKNALAKLENLQFSEPPFTVPNMNFFPHRCLSASLASWCVTTSETFINAFYKQLGVTSPLANYTDAFSVPQPRHKA